MFVLIFIFSSTNAIWPFNRVEVHQVSLFLKLLAFGCWCHEWILEITSATCILLCCIKDILSRNNRPVFHLLFSYQRKFILQRIESKVSTTCCKVPLWLLVITSLKFYLLSQLNKFLLSDGSFFLLLHWQLQKLIELLVETWILLLQSIFHFININFEGLLQLIKVFSFVWWFIYLHFWLLVFINSLRDASSWLVFWTLKLFRKDYLLLWNNFIQWFGNVAIPYRLSWMIFDTCCVLWINFVVHSSLNLLLSLFLLFLLSSWDQILSYLLIELLFFLNLLCLLLFLLLELKSISFYLFIEAPLFFYLLESFFFLSLFLFKDLYFQIWEELLLLIFFDSNAFFIQHFIELVRWSAILWKLVKVVVSNINDRWIFGLRCTSLRKHHLIIEIGCHILPDVYRCKLLELDLIYRFILKPILHLVLLVDWIHLIEIIIIITIEGL